MNTTPSHPSLDLINSAKSAVEPFQDEFIKFFWKGLGPTLSPNLNTSRTDVVIEAEILNAALESRQILDVCCGQPLLLQNLVQQLRNDPQRKSHYHYVACDMYISADDQSWQDLVDLARRNGVKLSLVTTDVRETTVLRASLRTKVRGKFDLIIFSNALHEISPLRIPQLLFTLVDLLSDKGQLVVIDPEAAWLLDPKRWNALKHLEQLEIDWEANAVWLPEATYRSILRLFGCTVSSSVVEKYQHFYVLHAHRGRFDASKHRELIKKATAMLREAIHDQLVSEIKRYTTCRDQLKNQLSSNPLTTDDKKKLLYKAVEFCSVCASQAKRVEVSEQL